MGGELLKLGVSELPEATRIYDAMFVFRIGSLYLLGFKKCGLRQKE